jgi:hypothetical protein
MRVVLIYPNRPRLSYGPVPGPYGLEILRAHVGPFADCEIINPYLHLDPRSALVNALAGADLVGVSIRNFDNGLAHALESSVDDVVQVVQWVRESAPTLPVLLGGVALTPAPYEWLGVTGADAGMVGACEQEFTELVRTMAIGQPFADAIKRLPSARLPDGSRGAGPIVHGPRLPAMQRERGYIIPQYPAAPLRTFAGCPLGCSYCVEHVATRTIERTPIDCIVAEAVAAVERYGARQLVLADSEVNAQGPARVIEILAALRAVRCLGDVEIVGYLLPRPMPIDLINALVKYRCSISLSLDHVSDEVLSRNGKNYRNADLAAFVSNALHCGLTVRSLMIFGLPGETQSTTDYALNVFDHWPASWPRPIVSPGVRVYPGTLLARRLLAGDLDGRWVTGEVDRALPFMGPVVYCEGWEQGDPVATLSGAA